MNLVPVFLIFFSKQPPVDSLAYRDFFSLEQAHQGLDQQFLIIFVQNVRFYSQVRKHKIQGCSFCDLRVLLQARYQSTDHQSVAVWVVVLLPVAVNSFLYHFDSRCRNQRNFIQPDGVTRLEML